MVSTRKRKAWIITGISVAVVLLITLLTVFIIFQAKSRKDTIRTDKWNLHALNQKIENYMNNGHTVETADDLMNALSADGDDLWKTLSPPSAQWGYHYWYDTENKKIVFEKFDVLAGTAAPAASGDIFEADSPRSVLKGFYLLDQAVNETNPIASFFEKLPTVTDTNSYKEVLSSIDFALIDPNKSLGDALILRMGATVLINANGIFTNADSAADISYGYIPENRTGEECILFGKIHHVRTAVDLSSSGISEIRVPKNIMIAEFCFESFSENVTLFVSADSAQALGEILSAQSARGPIRISTGETFRIEKNVLKDKNDAVVSVEQNGVQTDLLLVYRKPVTDFEITSNDSLNKGEGAVYIDPKSVSKSNPNGILYVAYDLPSFTLSARNFNADISCDDITWKEVSDTNQLISVDEHTGKVTLERLPEIGDRANYTAVVCATAKSGEYTETIEIYVVRPVGMRLNFGAQVFELNDGDLAETTFDYTATDNVKAFSVDEIVYNLGGMVTCNVGVSYTSDKANSENFSLSEAGVVKIQKTPGLNDVIRSVTIKAGCLQTTCKISVVDISDVPFEVKLKNGNYIYKVGNANPLRLGHFFQIIAGKTIGFEEIEIDVRSIRGTSILGDQICRDENAFCATLVMPEGQIMSSENWENIGIQFTGTGLCTVEIRTTKTASVKITLEIVNGTNITEWTTGTASGNLVLQGNVTVPAKNYMLKLGKYTLYGNGFTIDAKAVTKNIPSDDPSTPEIDNRVSEDVITVSGGGLDGVVLLGSIYKKVQRGSDEHNPYWVHGVNVSKGATITNSYLYGFRTPIRVNAGTLDMRDTVLDGGCLANMYVTGAKALNFHNVTTIQIEREGVLGSGILFANNDGTITLTVTGEFNQYNYAEKKQLTTVGEMIGGMMSNNPLIISGAGLTVARKLSDMGQFKHDKYYHLGLMVLGQGENSGGSVVYPNMPKIDHNLLSFGYTAGTNSASLGGYHLKVQLIAIDKNKCGGCMPQLKPKDLTGDGTFDHLDFQFRLGNASVSSN